MWTILRRTFMVLLALIAGGLFYLIHYHLRNHDRIVSRHVSADGRGTVTLLSRTYTIDKIYQSMMGPYSNQWALNLLEDVQPSQPPRLLWLTGVKTELMQVDGATPTSQE